MINEGCAYAYCSEDISLIENYDLAINDPTQSWDCHHRRECVDGVFTSRKELIANGLYYNRPASELIFLTKADHKSLHSKNPATWKKISESLKGEKNYMYGKHHTEEHKQKLREIFNRPDVKKKVSDGVKLTLNRPEVKKKMSDAAKGRPAHNKGKKLSDEMKKKVSENTKRAMNDPVIKQKLLDAMRIVRQNPEYLDKLRKSRIGRRWYTDGVNNRYVAECPGEGWHLGKTNHKKRS